jgi:hypothetical protein
MRGLHGDIINDARGTHAGNKFHVTFFNDGTYGLIAGVPEAQVIRGTWPDDNLGLRHPYLIDGNLFICSEVIDANGQLRHIHSTNRSAGAGQTGQWSTGDISPSGKWWTFLALPGFNNPDTNKIAMSKWKFSWPPAGWPDHSDDPSDPGWKGQWNGYFGKGQFNADEESYFVADDYQNAEFDFYPDSTDRSRKGLGIRMYCRGFQWSQALVDDALFILFDFENIGTYFHDKVVFGYKVGNNLGSLVPDQGNQGNDDCAAYELDIDLAYMYDFDNQGYGGPSEWPNGVGYIGGAFLESPGNPRDGIDNDDDGRNGSGKLISEDLWTPRILRKGDKIVLTDYKTFERKVKTFGTDLEPGELTLDKVFIHYQDQTYVYSEGDTLKEFQNDLIDNNLNGIIDENNGSTFGTGASQVRKYLYLDVKYKDYVTGEGVDNLMIDERRDDGIDNDGDWNALTDDLGQDGVASTKDTGEKDGKPTSGEPHFDKLDIHETDMIGLTSFSMYDWAGFGQYDDEACWTKLRPGNLDDLKQNANTEIMWGSGYFTMPPGETQRFSMAILLAFTLDELRENHKWATTAYSENYNFSKAPPIPNVLAVVGDKRVTLTWDNLAEKFKDSIKGEAFEGYKIYRSTDPSFADMPLITDGKGNALGRKPLAQFDLKNGIKGYSPVPLPGSGVQFYLGDDTGLQHTWTDTTAINGFTYYYAVTSYDHGDVPKGISPTECSKSIIVSADADPVLGMNVVRVRPEAPVAGYKPAKLDSVKLLIRPNGSGTATGSVSYKIFNLDSLPDGRKFQITFEDTVMKNFTIPGSAAGVTVNVPLSPVTKNYTLVDVTSGDTLLNKCTIFRPDTGNVETTVRGFEVVIFNAPALVIDSARTGWNRSDIFKYSLTAFKSGKIDGKLESADYLIEFGKPGTMGTSTAYTYQNKELPAVPVNFRVYKVYPSDTVTGEVKVESKFAFYSRDGSTPDSIFSGFTTKTKFLADQIFILNDNNEPGFVFTYSNTIARADTAFYGNPTPGDYIWLRLRKPFLSHDVVEFVTKQARVDEAQAKLDLNKIQVVPNPYVVSNSWEPPNLFSNGRGPRVIHFTHLPAQCTIKIFNIRGQLVRTLEHKADLRDGTKEWDLRTKDQLDIAFGVYVYYVDAGKIGTKVGKFAVIK